MSLTATSRSPLGVAHPRLVHLGDRRGGDRFAEFDEQRIDRRAERGFERGDGGGAVDGRHAVLKLLQLGRDPRADDVGPRGEELAELDVGRAEPVDRRRQAAEAVRGAPRQEIGEEQRKSSERRQRQRIEIDEGAFAGENEAGPRQPEYMCEVGQPRQVQSFQPEWIATTPPVSRMKSTRAKPAAAIIAAKRSGGGNLRIDSTR